ncbi:hypothetical protein DCAR_0522044 [Daucus carota subsp. sativus]|uniref:Major facilitator superfamily (MFS) profile domain-containing protein n=1 Tax=Daucus carota subsp. sativus TaxID=79200 RepID=A0AAF0X750_DAUCS|nr:hypothetical protein DCAR_0522044 [Daucus carota subsp. sativus]
MTLTAVFTPPAITTKYSNTTSLHINTSSTLIYSPFHFLFSSTKLTIYKESSEDDDDDDLGWLPCFPHVLTASMSNFLFGFHIGVMNGPIVAIAHELGFEAGAFLGGITSSSLVDKLGCRRTLQLATIPLIVGAILSAQAHGLDELLLGRFLVGLGIGVNTVLVSIYISEVSPTKYRGSLGSLCQIGTCTGIIVSLFLGIFSENDSSWWRTMLYISSLPGFALVTGMQFAVESPRWLCKAGRLDDAELVIRNLWGSSKVEKAMEEFQSVIKTDGGDLHSRWSELLEEPNSKVAFIGGALFLLQQFAGINGVLYFSSLTFHDVGITSSALASLCVGVTNFAGALGALYLIDRQGRQRLLIGSYMGMVTGPATGLIIPELSSSRTRGKIMSFSFSVHWVCNFLIGLFFLDLVKTFGVAPVYASFGSVSLLAAAFSSRYIVETKGRSLEEIEMSLNLNFPPKEK